MENFFGIPDDWMERYEQAANELMVQDCMFEFLASIEIKERIQMEEVFGQEIARESESELCLDEGRIRYTYEVPIKPQKELGRTLYGFKVEALYI